MAVTRVQIADVFEKHVERFGYSKTTLDEVSADLRISKKTLYTHFDGKADIYRYVVERIAAQSRSTLRGSIKDLETPGEKLTALVRLVLKMARAHIEETSATEWRAQLEVAEDAFREAIRSLVDEILSEGIAAGEFGMKDRRLATHMVDVIVMEYTLMVRDDPMYDGDDELAAAIRRFVG